MDIDQVYSNFIEYHEVQGRDFPCTDAQFIARAYDYARAYHQGMIEKVVAEICVKGIGPNLKGD